MPNNTLFQDVYAKLTAQLLERRLRPGDIINRRQIAGQLGVSIAPVREAFQRLEQEGYLVSRPRVGTMVKSIDVEEVRGRLILREALECQAARLYCGAPVRKNLPRLKRLAKQVEGRHPSTAEQWQAEVDFHRALVELAGCPVLTQAFEGVMRLSLFFAVNRMFPPINLGKQMGTHHRNHLLLLDALTTDDPVVASQVAYEHAHFRLADAAQDVNSLFYSPPATPTKASPAKTSQAKASKGQ